MQEAKREEQRRSVTIGSKPTAEEQIRRSKNSHECWEMRYE